MDTYKDLINREIIEKITDIDNLFIPISFLNKGKYPIEGVKFWYYLSYKPYLIKTNY